MSHLSLVHARCFLRHSPIVVDLSRSSTRFSLTTDLPARNSDWPIASRFTDPLLLPRRTWTCEWNNFGEPFPTFADPIHRVKVFYDRFDERFSRTRSILSLGRNFFDSTVSPNISLEKNRPTSCRSRCTSFSCVIFFRIPLAWKKFHIGCDLICWIISKYGNSQVCAMHSHDEPRVNSKLVIECSLFFQRIASLFCLPASCFCTLLLCGEFSVIFDGI